MSKLVIVESPAKAKTISRFLGKGYRVEASFGHVRDLPESAGEIPPAIKGQPWARIAVDIEGDFTPYYVVPKDKARHVSELKTALKEAKELLLATDEDREGESISWHLLQILKPKVPIRRIVFHEITEEAIREALANPRDVDENLVKAQESRRIVDRLFGYSLSPVLWKKVQGRLSAGRVQSVAVRLIVEREEERRAFVKASYWDLDARVRGGGAEFTATLVRVGDKRVASGRDFDERTGTLKNADSVQLLNETLATQLAADLEKRTPWRVASVEEKPASQRPYPPFTTSTLQQEANRKLGFGASRAMRAAQTLYEGVDIGEGERTGLITYMRTDSTTLSDRALNEAARFIKKEYGDDYYTGPRRYQTKTRNAQEAHEAIRPTDLSRLPQDMAPYLEPDQARLYELIWKRTVASQMADAQLLRTNVELAATTTKGTECRFAASGKAIKFPGFLRAYVEGSDDPAAELGDRETILPTMREGDMIAAPGAAAPLTLQGVEAKGHETQPPARYTEASLVKKLEEEGIGRPSTYASIIGTIQDRGYVQKQGNALVPTFVAFAVIRLLRDHFDHFIDIGFTARMEETLDAIANGEREWLSFVKSFYRDGEDGYPGLATHIEKEEPKIEFATIELGTDPETAAPVRVRIGKFGPFVQRGEGGAGNTATIPDDIAPAELTLERAVELISKRADGPRVLGKDPETGLTVYAANGRFGAYVQLGETPEKGSKEEKPKRASLPAGESEQTISLERALHLLALPRSLGRHPESGAPLVAGIGRFGPYVKHGDEFRSLEEGDDVYTITLERAVALLASPKKFARRTASKPEPLRTLGNNAAGKPVNVMEGRYGAYVTDGETNATLPKAETPQSITLERALELLKEREGAPKKGKAGAKKKAGAAPKAPAKKRAPRKGK